MTTRQWFVGLGSTATGPFTDRQLREQARSGALAPTALVRTAEMAKPVPAKRVKGLFPPEPAAPVLAAVPPPPPGVPLVMSPTTRIHRPESPAPTITSTATPVSAPLSSASLASASLASPSLPLPAVAPPVLPELPPVMSTGPSHDPLAASLGLAAGTPLFRTEPEATPERPSTARWSEPAARPSTARWPGMANAPVPTARPVPMPLALPRWRDLWPIATVVLGLGWIFGGLAGNERAYADGDGWVAFLLMLGAVPLSLVAFLAWLRPRQLPLGTAIGTGLFTAVIGVMALLALQWMAALATSGVRFYGRAAIFLIVLVAIGSAYALTGSDSIGGRWVGFVFGVGLCEEMIKLLPLSFLLHRAIHRVLGLHGFIALGFVSGLGFGISEALYIYNPWSGMPTVDMNIIRWYAVVPSHGLYTAACAAALWKLGDHLTGAESVWGKLGVLALASLGMALVHGTYNTLCSLGTVVAMLMDAGSLLLLAWWVRYCTPDETDPPETPDDVATLVSPRPLRILLSAGLVVAVLALLPTTSQDQALKSRLPPAWAALVDGVTVAPQTREFTDDPPIQVRFVADLNAGAIVAQITNVGTDVLSELEFACFMDASQDHEVIVHPQLLPGETFTIPADEWFFEAGESLLVNWYDCPEDLRYLAPIPRE